MLTRHIFSLAAVGAIAAVGAPRAVFAGTNGACCLPDATCDALLDAAGCAVANGLYQGDGTSCDRTICVNVPFTFNLSPGDTNAELPQFDDAGGALNLLKATLAVDGQINAEVFLVNISMGQFIFDTIVTYTGELTATLDPLDPISVVVAPPPFDCGPDVILGPTEQCELSDNFPVPVPPGMSMATAPSTDLGAFVGTGTIPAFIEAEGIFAYEGGVPFTFAVPLHNVSGTARVAYLFEAKDGACCLPDGSCQDLTSAECDTAGGTSWTLDTPCSQADCGGACCLQDGTCIDDTTESDCETGMGGEWQGQGSACDPTTSCPGACCLDNGDCLDDQTLAQCDAAGGEYQGLNSTCMDVGDSCCVGVLGDFLWNDLNGDGIQDPGEPGIDGIRVILSLKLDGGGTQFLAETTTSNGGAYEFTALCAGDYQLEIDPTTIPPGFEETPPNEGSDPTLDSDCDGGMVMLTLPTNGSNDDTVDCGFREPAGTIGDFIWQDTNGDGIQDPGEPGIPNVTVCLYSLPGDDPLGCTTTNGDGEYFFTNLDAGDYRVEVDASTVPPNFTPSPANAGDDESDSDCVDGSATATLATSQDTDDTIDCGFVPPSGVIGNFVWQDTNGDGIQDPDEPGLPGVAVCLCLLGADGESEVGCTTTNAAGLYEFTGLAAGDYLVKVDESTLPPGLNPSPPNAGGDDVDSDCVDGAAPVTLPDNMTMDLSVDCGYAPVLDCQLACEVVVVQIPDDDDDDVDDDDDDIDDDDGIFTGLGRALADDDDDDVRRGGSDTLLRASYETSDDCEALAVVTTECAVIPVPNDVLIRVTCLAPLPDDDDDINTDFDCDDKIVTLTMIWDGTEPIRIRAYDGDPDDELLADIDHIQIGDVVTVGGLTGSNDVVWEIYEAGTDHLIGESEFHRSCSDDDMDGPEDCGSRQGNGKDDDEDLINDWILEGLVDGSGSSFDCSMPGGMFAVDRRMSDDDDVQMPDRCSWFFDVDGVLVIQAESAVYSVTATNAAGEEEVCEIDLCGELDGIVGEHFELQSFDAGADPQSVAGGLDSLTIEDQLHVERVGHVLNLVDNVDDDGLGQVWCEAVYVMDLYVGPDATLLTNGCPVYYVNALIEGTVDDPANLIPVDLSPPCPGDTDDSGAVDFADLNALMTSWGTCQPDVPCVHDLDGNGEVGFADLTITLSTWGTCPE